VNPLRKGGNENAALGPEKKGGCHKRLLLRLKATTWRVTPEGAEGNKFFPGERGGEGRIGLKTTNTTRKILPTNRGKFTREPPHRKKREKLIKDSTTWNERGEARVQKKEGGRSSPGRGVKQVGAPGDYLKERKTNPT